MEVSLTIDWDVTETTSEVKKYLEEVIAEEARGFVESLRQRLAAEGITSIKMSVGEAGS